MTRTRTNKIWTEKDKEFAKAIIISYAKQGKQLQEAFNYIAKKFGIKANTVKHRWYTVLKDTCLEEFEEAREYAEKTLLDQINTQQENVQETKSKIANSSSKDYITGELFAKKSTKVSVDQNSTKDETIVKKVPLKQDKPEKPMTKLQMMVNSIKTMEEENLTVINSGQGGIDFIVINNEQDYGYIINTQENKVTNCNCAHRTHRDTVCKHMLKVALEKNLEIF